MARVAVSDGTSESAFAREWARILTDAFVDRPPNLSDLTPDSLSDWLKARQAEWHDGVPWAQLPWHGEAKAQAGAFATLQGLTMEAAPDDSRPLSWQAVAVGDSCLFVATNRRGLPLVFSGSFACVFSVSAENRKFAVRCFTREIRDQRSRYAQLGDYINQRTPAGFRLFRLRGPWD